MHPYILRYRGYIPLGVTTVAEVIWVHILRVGVVYPIRILDQQKYMTCTCTVTVLQLV